MTEQIQSSAGQIETRADVGTDKAALVRLWLSELAAADKHEQTWRKRAKKTVERYRGDHRREDDDTAQMNLLFANTEILKGALYQKPPAPDVRRRFLDKDPAAREAAKVLERGLTYSLDAYDFHSHMAQAVEDMELPGRGCLRVRYRPAIDGGELAYEAAECEYVEWDMVRFSPAKTWDKVRWVAFGQLLTRDDLKAQFKGAGARVTLDWAAPGHEADEDELYKRALVWEIWDKTKREVVAVTKGYDAGPLAVVPDPLKLEGFFPTPRPLARITTTSTMVPVVPYTLYQDQERELNDITQRITALTDALRRRGVYDASIEELAQLARAGDNQFVPVQNYTALAEKGGLEKVFQTEPIETLAKVLLQLYENRDQVKQTIYEITGISDIVRGATKATETLGAQELKSQYANIRIAPAQGEVQRYARDLCRLKAEIIAEHFSAQTLQIMTGVQLPSAEQKQQAAAALSAAQAGQLQLAPEQAQMLQRVLKKPTWDDVLAILRSDKLRGFRVDIETDSTIKPQADVEQKNRVELITAVTGYLEKALPAVQAGMMPQRVASEILLFGVRGFKLGPSLEEVLTQWAGDTEEEGEEALPASVMQAQAQLKAGAEQLQAEREAVMQERQALDSDKQKHVAERTSHAQEVMRHDYDKQTFAAQQKSAQDLAARDEQIAALREQTQAELEAIRKEAQKAVLELIKQFEAALSAKHEDLDGRDAQRTEAVAGVRDAVEEIKAMRPRAYRKIYEKGRMVAVEITDEGGGTRRIEAH